MLYDTTKVIDFKSLHFERDLYPAATAGDTSAVFAGGMAQWFGYNEQPVRKTGALDWFNAANELSDPLCTATLACLATSVWRDMACPYNPRQLVNDNIVAWVESEAAKDQPYALWIKGMFHRFGLGLPVSRDQAIAAFQKGADLHEPTSQYFLGGCYLEEILAGLGKSIEPHIKGARVQNVAVDVALLTKTRNLFKASAAQGNVEAMIGLANPCPPDEAKETLQLILKAAAQESPAAAVLIGRYYSQGIGGVAINPEEAFFWFEQAAESGYIPAWFALAKCYSDGRGVEKSAGHAFLCYQKVLLADGQTVETMQPDRKQTSDAGQSLKNLKRIAKKLKPSDPDFDKEAPEAYHYNDGIVYMGKPVRFEKS